MEEATGSNPVLSKFLLSRFSICEFPSRKSAGTACLTDKKQIRPTGEVGSQVFCIARTGHAVGYFRLERGISPVTVVD